MFLLWARTYGCTIQPKVKTAFTLHVYKTVNGDKLPNSTQELGLLASPLAEKCEAPGSLEITSPPISFPLLLTHLEELGTLCGVGLPVIACVCVCVEVTGQLVSLLPVGGMQANTFFAEASQLAGNSNICYYKIEKVE